MKPFTNILINGARIIDPCQHIDHTGSLLIEEGKISAIATGEELTPAKGCSIIDASGLIVCPGFIDLHCHLREPGFEEKETIATGSRAAATGGFTTICCMPNTNPPLDNRSSVEYVLRKAKEEGLVRILPIASITKGRQGKELTEMSELVEAGVIGFSDDGDTVCSSRIMSLAMDYAKSLRVPIMDHCEDRDLADGGSMNQGWVSTRLGLKGIPCAAEEIIISRDIALAKLTGLKLHIAHVSTEYAVSLIQRAKDDGISVTAEVTPHHLLLTEEHVMSRLAGNNRMLAYDTNAKVNPPLRTGRDVAALVTGLKSGILDCIATDHAPHCQEDKLCEFGVAAFGISGFETGFASLMGLVHSGQIDLATLISRLTAGPAGIINYSGGELGTLKLGKSADLCIFDPDREWVLDAKTMVSKGRNTPYDGHKFKGKVLATIYSGSIVYRDSSLSVGESNAS